MAMHVRFPKSPLSGAGPENERDPKVRNHPIVESPIFLEKMGLNKTCFLGDFRPRGILGRQMEIWQPCMSIDCQTLTIHIWISTNLSSKFWPQNRSNIFDTSVNSLHHMLKPIGIEITGIPNKAFFACSTNVHTSSMKLPRELKRLAI